VTTSPPLERLLDRTADAVAAVRAGRSLTEALDAIEGDLRPGVLALASDVMRRLGTASAIRARLAPRDPVPVVDALLLSALALLVPRAGSTPYADHTLVDQAVTAARRRTPAAAGFVNAVLRRFVRERIALLEAVSHDGVAAFNHPLWWIERVRQDWPAQWRELLAADNEPPPMVLRVNARRTTAPDYVQRLLANGRPASVVGPQADELEQLGDPGGALFPRQRAVVHDERKRDDLFDRLPLVQRRVRILEDDLHLAAEPPQLAARDPEEVGRLEVDAARGGFVETEQEPGECRLPRARLADEADGLAAGEHERDVVDRLDDAARPRSAEAEVAAQVVDHDERLLADGLDARRRHVGRAHAVPALTGK